MDEKVVELNTPKGRAMLICGDSVDIIYDKHVLFTWDSIVTDPPYGMSYQSNHRKEKHKAIEGDNTADLLNWTTHLTAMHSKYIFCRWENLLDVPKPKSFITWVKNNWTAGDLHHEHGRQTETILFYPGVLHNWTGNRPTDVIMRDRQASNEHPTEKPVSLMTQLVSWTSGTVFDPFMGSGSTGVACGELGRNFVGIERDPHYFELAVKRITAAYQQNDLFTDIEYTGDGV